MVDRISKVAQDDVKTTYRVLLTPFGSPEQKDLHGEFFHKGTYFGDDVMTTKFALYEHHVNHINNPFLPEGKSQVIGVAKYVKTDDMGRWFDFEIKRSNDYHDYIEKLVDLKLMGASSQCYAGSKVLNAKTAGQIDEWLESEGSMTVTPASPDTLEKIYDAAKTFAPQLLRKDSSGQILPLILKESSPATPIDPADTPTPDVDNDEDRDTEDPEEDIPLDQQVAEILNAPTPEEVAAAEEETAEEKRFNAAVAKAVAKALEPINAQVMKVSGYFDVYVSIFGDLQDEEAKGRVMEVFALLDKTAAMTAKQQEHGRSILSIATAMKNQGIKGLGHIVAPAPGTYTPAPAAPTAAPGSRKSNNQPRRPSGIPANAPGG